MIAGLLGVGIIVLAGVAITANLPVDVSSGLITCTPPDPNFTGDYAQRSDCVKAVLVSGTGRHGVAAVNKILASTIAEHPQVLSVCHPAAHEAGRQAFVHGEDLPAVLKQAPEEACFSGLLHGMFDAWAVGSPTRADLEILSRSCDDVDSPGHDMASAGRCSEGVGHAIWTAWGSAEPCSVFTTAHTRAQCGSGVVMQSYWPVGADKPIAGQTEEDVIRLCAAWPANVEAEGCQSGAAYVFQYALAFAVEKVPFGQPPTTDTETAISDAAAHQVSQCARVAGDAHICERGLLHFLPSRLQEWPAAAARVCAAFREPTRGSCMRSITPDGGSQTRG